MNDANRTFGWIFGTLALGLTSCADAAEPGPGELGVHTEMLEPGPFVGALDGRLMQFPCANTPGTDDCASAGYVVNGVVTSCVNGKSEMILDHPIGGTPGAWYAMTMHLYGIMEPKYFGTNAVIREAAPGAPQRDGGTPTPWAQHIPGGIIPGSTYSAYEIVVHDQNGGEMWRYYVNADISNGHWTLRIDYEKTITIIGGGFVRLRRFDPNCYLIKNCGTTGGYPCQNKARIVDLSAANPPPPTGPYPTGLNQPGLNQSSNHGGQWWFIDVTNVQPL